jgi:hypothetical protein
MYADVLNKQLVLGYVCHIINLKLRLGTPSQATYDDGDSARARAREPEFPT